MKINVEFPEMVKLMRRMGAEMSSWRLGASALDPFERLIQELEEGIAVDINEVKVRHGGLLTYKDRQILLYIKASRMDRAALLNIEEAPRFHVFECTKIKDMRGKGRFERYVATINASGEFLIEATDHDTKRDGELRVRLHVCKYCLNKLHWNGYNHYLNFDEKNRIRDNFSIKEFLGEFSTFFQATPKYTDQTAPLDGYARNWSKIATRYKERKNWRCESCKVDLSGSKHRKLLHCHHISGVITDNSLKNLMALCVICHTKQPLHNRMSVKSRDRWLIESLRLGW